jgi:hypothetical protein
MAVDFMEVDPLSGQQQGREGLKQVISAFRTAFPDIHWVIEEDAWGRVSPSFIEPMKALLVEKLPKGD